jgi:hypothetical protein
MVRQSKKKSRQKESIISALHPEEVELFFDNMTDGELSRLKYQLTDEIYWWMANPTEARINSLVVKYPSLTKVLNIFFTFCAWVC